MGVNVVFMKLPSTSGIPVFCPYRLLPVNPQMLFCWGPATAELFLSLSGHFFLFSQFCFSILTIYMEKTLH